MIGQILANYKFKMMTFLIVIAFAFNCRGIKDTSIIPLKMINYIDTIQNEKGIFVNKIDYYLIKSYSDTKHTKDLIDSFAYKNKNANVNNYSIYKMLFYKESTKTNIKNLSANPKDLYRYSQDHDLIYEYSWMNGKFLAKLKFKNGEIIEPKYNIQLEEIPKQ